MGLVQCLLVVLNRNRPCRERSCRTTTYNGWRESSDECYSVGYLSCLMNASLFPPRLRRSRSPDKVHLHWLSRTLKSRPPHAHLFKVVTLDGTPGPPQATTIIAPQTYPTLVRRQRWHASRGPPSIHTTLGTMNLQTHISRERTTVVRSASYTSFPNQTSSNPVHTHDVPHAHCRHRSPSRRTNRPVSRHR